MGGIAFKIFGDLYNFHCSGNLLFAFQKLRNEKKINVKLNRNFCCWYCVFFSLKANHDTKELKEH
jgi:hypothetical protein